MRSSHWELLFLHGEEQGWVKLQRTGRKLECIPQWEFILGGVYDPGQAASYEGAVEGLTNTRSAKPLAQAAPATSNTTRPTRPPPGRPSQCSVGKANAKADSRPHADLLPQKSSDEIPNFMLQFGYPFARDPKNPRSGHGDPEPNSAFKFGDHDVQHNAGDDIPNELEVQRNAGGNILNELEVQRNAGVSIPNEREAQRHAGGNIPNELEVQHDAGGNVPNELEVRRNARGDILNELEVQHNARGNISNELATSPAPCRGGSHWCYATGENTDLFPSKRPVLGCVKDGFDVIMKISNTPTDCRDSPQDPPGGFK